jgi:hypothetical protein
MDAIYFRNVGGFLTGYTALYPKIFFFSINVAVVPVENLNEVLNIMAIP